MNVRIIIEDTHVQNILCIAWDAYGRRIFTGSEDHSVKIWDLDSGKHIRTGAKHESWVTSLVFSPKLRLLFSSSLDGLIVGWNSSMKPVCELKIHSPVSCLAWDSVNRYLVVGAKQNIYLYTLKKKPGIEQLEKVRVFSMGEDFVKSLFTFEGKIYVGSYDKFLRVYDAADGRLLSNTKAHMAGVNVLTANSINNCIVTGSQDKKVKMWSSDGGQVSELGPFPNKVTGLAVNSKTKTLWIACNGPSPIVVDARTGSNVTNYMSELIPPLPGGVPARSSTSSSNIAAQYSLHPQNQTTTSGYGINSETTRNFILLGHIIETDEIVATTSLREIVIWKYNPMKPITTLYGHSQSVECLSYSQRTLQFFSGGGDSSVRKWVLNVKEQNSFIYNYDILQGHSKAVLACVHYEPLDILITASVDKTICLWSFTELPKVYAEDGIYRSVARVPSAILLQNTQSQKQQYLQQVKQRFKERQEQHQQELEIQNKIETETEEMDLQDSKSYATNSTKSSIERRKKKSSSGSSGREMELSSFYDAIDISIDEEMLASSVGGMSYQYVLSEHSRRVTALACASVGLSHFLISVSWDLSICFWDINSDTRNFLYKIENAHQDYITDVAFSPSLSRFATSSVDNHIHLWDFETRKLLHVLSGHTAEVSSVKWCNEGKLGACWMSGSEDRTVRLWSGEGNSLCVIKCEGVVTSLCVDKVFGHAIVATEDHVIRVYDVTDGYVLESHKGHEDTINAIIHIPEAKQYISAGWDRSIRIWNACEIESQPVIQDPLPFFMSPSPSPSPSLSPSLSPSPNKSRPSTAGSDSTVSLYSLDSPKNTKETNFSHSRPSTFAELNPLILPKIMQKDKSALSRADEYIKTLGSYSPPNIEVTPPMSSAGQKLAKKFADIETAQKEKDIKQRATPKLKAANKQ